MYQVSFENMYVDYNDTCFVNDQKIMMSEICEFNFLYKKNKKKIK